VPGGSDDAFIIANGTYAVTLDTSPTINSLTLGGSSGTQTVATAGSTLTLNNASVVNANGILDFGGGSLAGGGLLTVNGLINWTGGSIAASSTLTIATNGAVVLAGTNGTDYYLYGALTNAGTVRLVSGNLQLPGNCYGGPGQLVNLAGALVDITADVSINNCSGRGLLVNQGTVRKSGGTSTSTIYPTFNNFGTLDMQTGTVNLQGSYSLTGGTLNFGINSLNSYGTINLHGSAALTGTVSANLNNGYVPIGNSVFPVLTYGSRTDIFTNTVLPLPDALLWQTNYHSSYFDLTVLNVRPVPVPIPDRWLTN
jgi:hypothetical protein